MKAKAQNFSQYYTHPNYQISDLSSSNSINLKIGAEGF